MFELIQERLYRYWSPEIIALKWNEPHKNDSIFFNTIYSAIKAGIFKKISSQSHLRRRGKQKYGQRCRYCTIPPDKTIHDLSEEAKYRECLNDWEGDTIRTTPAKGCIVTLFDRKSRFLAARGGGAVSSQKVHDAIKEAFKEKGIHPKTIVFDSGSEFAKFRELETALRTLIYFADIHSPWHRGLNENINGCLRFFLPRGMDFRNLEDGYLETVVSLLNNRPRKCLGVKSPHEVFCCTWLCNIDATQTKRNQQDALPTFLLASFALAKLEAGGQALISFPCPFLPPAVSDLLASLPLANWKRAVNPLPHLRAHFSARPPAPCLKSRKNIVHKIEMW